MKLGIRSKLFLVSLGLIVISLAIGTGYLTPVLSRSMTEQINGELAVRLDLATRLVVAADLPRIPPPDQTQSWSTLARELAALAHARVTLVDDRGEVLGDSGVAPEALAQLPNHSDRPEIAGALRDGHGASTRYSNTLGLRMSYVAAEFHNPKRQLRGVVRLALPLSEVDRVIARLHLSFAIAALLALSVAVLMSSMAAHLAARSVRLLTATARRMVVRALGTPLPPADRDELAALGRDLDVLASNLGNAMRQLVEERDLLNSILSSMREGVLVLAAARPADDTAVAVVRLCNPALREMMLLSQDPTGQPLPREAAGNAELSALIEQTRTSAAPVLGEVRIEGMKPRTLLVRAARLASDSGGILAVFVDVTELRRLESLRRDFVANVSHELRTPVTAMRSAAETIRGAAARDPEAAERFLAIIERNGERLQRMVEDLLDLSRIESQQFRMNLTELPLPELAVHLLELLHSRADQKRIRLQMEMAPDLPWVHVDRRALEQVLVNLLDNAVKYCPAGSEITLRATAAAESSASGQRFVRVTVTDNGPGIAAQHLPRLFERFYRVDAGRSRELGGTGLGLAIVKHLVEAMQGEVWVESELGKGTTFGFSVLQARRFAQGSTSADAVPPTTFHGPSLAV